MDTPNARMTVVVVGMRQRPLKLRPFIYNDPFIAQRLATFQKLVVFA
jgi:hypothetical protein